MQSNHFSSSKSAILSRYTRTILCWNNLFLISALGNATVGLCRYICSLFSWKPWAKSAAAAQDSLAKLKKMLWMKQQWWTIWRRLFLVTLVHMCTLKEAKGLTKHALWAAHFYTEHKQNCFALIWFNLKFIAEANHQKVSDSAFQMKPTAVFLMRLAQFSSPSCCSAPQTIQRSINRPSAEYLPNAASFVFHYSDISLQFNTDTVW